MVNREKRKEKVECFKCGKVRYRAREYKEVECYSCGHKEHIKRECTAKKGGLRWERKQANKEGKKTAKQEMDR